MTLHVGSFERPPLLTDLLVADPEQSLSREDGVIAGKAEARNFKIGTVLAELPPVGNVRRYTEVDFADGSGAEVPSAVAVVNGTVQANTDAPIVVVDWLVAVRKEQLDWPEAATQAQIDAGIAALRAAGIKVR